METQIKIDVDDIRNECFVIMPFDGLFKSQYENVIKPAIESTGLESIRGDEVFSKPHVMDDIWISMRQCRVVVAELTNKNPNVFYELGLAHAIGKPTVIITRNETDVPFDLKAHRYIFYDTNDPFWGLNLQNAISNLLKKILSEKEFGSGLKGITLSNSESLPQKPKEPRLSIPIKPAFDINGIWKTSWTHETFYNKTVTHHAVINLHQDGSKVTGDCTISSPYKDDISVVNEIIVGSISENDIAFQGVSYTFIKQGQVETYALDAFQLKFVDNNSLSGVIISNYQKDKISIKLEKLNMNLPSNKSLELTEDAGSFS